MLFILILCSSVILLAIFSSKFLDALGIPALLFFMCLGMLFGTDGIFKISFADFANTKDIASLALGFIIFYGGFCTKWATAKPIIAKAAVLSTAGVFLTAVLTSVFCHFVLELSFLESFLIGAVISSTDAASVFSILKAKNLHLKENTAPLLEIESGSNDPMAYMLTVVLIQLIQSSGMGASQIAFSFVIQFVVGAAAGYLLGKLAILMLNRLNIDNQSLYPILLLSFVFFTFSITDLMKGNGYLAVYIAGMMVGNNKIMHRKEIYTFMDGLTWLFQIIMFLCLGLLVNPHEMLEVAVVALLIGVFMIVIGRPLSIFLCLLPFGKRINMKSKMFVSWVGLRGAVPIIFATYPVVAGVPGADVIFNIVFFITILSLVIQGTTVSKVARIMGLSTPMEKTGNDFGVELPEDIDSDLCDVTVTREMLDAKGDTLKDMNLPQGTLVMIVKRDNEYLIPNGTLKLHVGDKLLLISEKTKE